MRNIKLTISYDGTNYSGWQIQPKNITIQGVIKDKLQLILQENIKIIGASRTDAGVHAKEQVANFLTEKSVSCKEIFKRLNKLLPDDIKILNVEEIYPEFNARKSAKRKTYRYYIYFADIPSPFFRNYSWFIDKKLFKLNIEFLNKISIDLIGTHNFLSFSGQKDEAKSFERTVYEAYWDKDENFIIFTINGKGFLKNMVRKIVGSLIAISKGKEPEYFIKYLLAIKDRREGKYCAPSQGLFLEKIYY